MATDIAFVYALSMHTYFIEFDRLKHVVLFVTINKKSYVSKTLSESSSIKNQLLIYLFHLEKELQAIMQIIEEGMVDIFQSVQMKVIHLQKKSCLKI